MSHDERLVFFDLETGGFDPDKHPLIQIAGIACNSSTLETIEEFEVKIRFDVSAADESALAVNSYNESEWMQEAKPVHNARVIFSRFLERHATLEMRAKKTGRPYSVAELAGYNAQTFDKPFLWAFYGREWVPAHPQVYDVLQLAKWYYWTLGSRPKNLKLETVAIDLGLIGPDQQTHDALDDVRLTIQVTSEIYLRMR